MGDRPDDSLPPVRFETHPDRYRHWRLELPPEHGGAVARLVLDVNETDGLRPGYALKLNSYDLGVDIELADALQRIRFEHPEVKAIVVRERQGPRLLARARTSTCSGSSSHGFKVNFCKFTNETRLYLEELSAETGVESLAALAGTASGGGYELALACDAIALADDGSSVVSLPEAPLLGVLPGTGGLTRLVDKRKVRRDLADAFSTMAEGVRGQRALEWGLVDEAPEQKEFEAAVRRRLDAMVARSEAPPRRRRSRSSRSDATAVTCTRRARRQGAQGHADAVGARRAPSRRRRRSWRGPARTRGPSAPGASSTTRCSTCASTTRASASSRSRRAATRRGSSRSTRCSPGTADDGLVREVTLLMKRVAQAPRQHGQEPLRARRARRAASRARSLELALAADRIVHARRPGARGVELQLSPMNAGPLPDVATASRGSQSRFLGRAGARRRAFSSTTGPFDTKAALEAGLVTFAPDDDRLGRRGAHRLRGAREPLARRADRAWRRACASAGPRRWRRRSSGASRAGRTGSSSGPTPSAREARSRSTASRSGPSSTSTAPERRARMSSVNSRAHPEQRPPRRRQAPAARARGLAAELHPAGGARWARAASRRTTSTCAPRSASTPTAGRTSTT